MLRQYIYLQTLLRDRRDQRGATAVEYGLLVALIAVAIIIVVGTLGDELVEVFTDTTTSINAR